MLMPKRTKFRKQQRGSMKGVATRGNKITRGEFGIVAMEPCWIRSNQIEVARIAINRHLRREGKVWINILATNRLAFVNPKVNKKLRLI